MIILEICQKQPFDIIAMTPRGILGLCCVHIAQLMTHPAVYARPFTLQLCSQPLGILQRVTKCQKTHILSKMYCRDFITSTLLDIGPKVSQRRGRKNRSFLLLPVNFWRTIKNLFPGI